jgi:DNA topoisomerase-1
MSWNTIVHDNKSQWIASYPDSINGKIKYFWLGATSNFKTQSDLAKFELARKLRKKIKGIRLENDKNLQSSDVKLKQIATALYFIDNFALRVGNEKGDDAADTVGVTGLRVEHIELLDNLYVKLDFLGKDSIRYLNKVKVSQPIYDNLREFMANKDKNDDLFDLVKSNDINKYLQEFMDGLTAKVFRTYNASYSFQKELDNISKKYLNVKVDGDKELELKILDEFNKANAKIAVLCNHQKKPSKKHPEQIEKINESIKKFKQKLKNLPENTDSKKIDKIKSDIKKLQNKKNIKIEQKNISLGTSKINYIDPRISISFLKRHNIDKSKIYSKTQIDKFQWAFDVDENFKF